MSADPRRDLSLAMRRIHRNAGEPSSREIAKAIGYSHTTVARALSGDRYPTWRVLSAIVRCLEGDENYFLQLWVAVRDADAPLAEVADGSSVEQYGTKRNVASVSGTVDSRAPIPLMPQKFSNAEFVDQNGVPKLMRQQQTTVVSVIMRNTGTTTWSAASSFNLGSQAPHDNEIWLPNGANRVQLPIPSVKTNELVSFTFRIRAPGLSGRYTFQWRMVQDGVTWFGERTPLLEITIL